MAEYKNKPGVAGRATVAMVLLNVPLLLVGAAVYWLAGTADAEWWARGTLAVVLAVAEFAIVITTIAPPLYDWITQKEFVEKGGKPSWEK